MISTKEAFAVSELLGRAHPGSLASLAACTTMIKKKKGEHLFWDKDEVNHVYLVAQGMASLYKLNHFGEKKVIFALGSGQLLNEVILQGLPASVNCEMLEDSAILAIPVKQFLEVMEGDGNFMRAVVDSMALKIRRLYRQMKNTTNDLRGDKRLAAKLWKLAKDNGVREETGIHIRMSLSITYLADMLGSKRETVSKQLKTLVEKGLVIVDKNQFYIPKPEKLAEYFKFDAL